MTVIFGVGPAVAAAVLGDVGDISRFPSQDHFAAYNGTAPVEVSSGNRVIRRLSLRGNRRMNHAIHMAAVTQIRYRHSRWVLSGVRSRACRAMLHPLTLGSSLTSPDTYLSACSHGSVRAKHGRSSSSSSRRFPQRQPGAYADSGSRL